MYVTNILIETEQQKLRSAGQKDWSCQITNDLRFVESSNHIA